VDICIGFNDDWSKPDDEVINFIRDTFENEGYRVGINKPYSNSITPRSVYDYKSIMIEVNKNMYMHEDTLEIKTVGFNTINSLLHNIYKQLLK
jgi:N-formylglutamate amidohydrolase